MKFRKKLFANIGYTGKMIVLMWQNDKMYLFYMFLDVIAYSSLPFISMYLVQQSIQMLEEGAEFQVFLPVVLGFIAQLFELQAGSARQRNFLSIISKSF